MRDEERPRLRDVFPSLILHPSSLLVSLLPTTQTWAEEGGRDAPGPQRQDSSGNTESACGRSVAEVGHSLPPRLRPQEIGGNRASCSSWVGRSNTRCNSPTHLQSNTRIRDRVPGRDPEEACQTPRPKRRLSGLLLRPPQVSFGEDHQAFAAIEGRDRLPKLRGILLVCLLRNRDHSKGNHQASLHG